MTPDPEERTCSRGGRPRKKRSKNSGPKNSRKRSSVRGSSDVASFLGVVLTLTTAGMTCSTTETNASSIARSGALGSVACWAPASWGGAARRSPARRRTDRRVSTAPILLRPRADAKGDRPHFEDPTGGPRDRSQSPAAVADHPGDFGAGQEEGQVGAPPTRDLGIDQERLEPLAPRGAEGVEPIPRATAPHAEGGGQGVPIESDGPRV